MKEDKFKQILEQHNNQFEKTISFKAVPNRLIMFDSGTDHGVENFGDNERLTLVAFFNCIKRSDDIGLKFPMSECKRVG